MSPVMAEELLLEDSGFYFIEFEMIVFLTHTCISGCSAAFACHINKFFKFSVAQLAVCTDVSCECSIWISHAYSETTTNGSLFNW